MQTKVSSAFESTRLKANFVAIFWWMFVKRTEKSFGSSLQFANFWLAVEQHCQCLEELLVSFILVSICEGLYSLFGYATAYNIFSKFCIVFRCFWFSMLFLQHFFCYLLTIFLTSCIYSFGTRHLEQYHPSNVLLANFRQFLVCQRIFTLNY